MWTASPPTDRVLDVGCGTGKSTRDVARVVVDGGVVGLDLSAPMLDLARTMGIVRGLGHDLSDAERTVALATLRETFTAHSHPDGVHLGSATWLVTAHH